jgi:rRNA maturation protein Rpf1
MFTTSRYAGRETRRGAQKMAAEAGERYVARGKRTIASLAALARKMGEARISVVEERSGKPGSVAVIVVSETGKWAWEKQ